MQKLIARITESICEEYRLNGIGSFVRGGIFLLCVGVIGTVFVLIALGHFDPKYRTDQEIIQERLPDNCHLGEPIKGSVDKIEYEIICD